MIENVYDQGENMPDRISKRTMQCVCKEWLNPAGHESLYQKKSLTMRDRK